MRRLCCDSANNWGVARGGRRVARVRRRVSRGLVSAGVLLGLTPLYAGEASPAGEQQRPLARTTLAACETITGSGVLAHAEVLCTPKLAGREAGTSGARLAAEYIAEQFRKAGLSPGGNAGAYFQTFKIRAGYHISGKLTMTRAAVYETFRRRKDYMSVHIPRDQTRVEAPCALVGYGLNSQALGFNEYAAVDVKGRAVIAFSGVPWSRETAVWLWRLEKRTRDSLSYKAKTAAAQGAVALFVVDDPAGWRRRLAFSEQLRLPDRSFPVDSPIPVVHLTRRAAARLAGVSESGLRELANRIRVKRQPESRLLDGLAVEYEAGISGSSRIGRNVIGVLPGSHPVLRKEAIAIGAHYDHLGEGIDGTYFGANDNAAGVGAVVQIARALKSLPEPPRRTVIFIAFAAEEIGKLGSNYYVSHPCMPIDKTVLMINFDMIGRNEPNQINAVATRSSVELHQIHQEANRHVGLELIHPENMRLGLSDHTAFYLARVPTVYFFGGLHADYNTVNDTPDRLIPGKTERVARLAFLTALRVAQRESRISFAGESAEWD